MPGESGSADRLSFDVLRPGVPDEPVRCTSAEEVLERLAVLLASQPVEQPFILAFAGTVPRELRGHITTAVLAHLIAESDREWIDDVTQATGWNGTRVTIDETLAPSFAGRPDGLETWHCGLWADAQTFVHLDLFGIDTEWSTIVDWTQQWAGITHWHPESWTSGLWSDRLFVVASRCLVEHRYLDEDGHYLSLAPMPDSPQRIARTIDDFIGTVQLMGAEKWLLTLLALGFPTDGSADEFPVGYLPGSDDPGYEVSSLVITPPDEARPLLEEYGRITPERAAVLRTGILHNLSHFWEDLHVKDLKREWKRLLVRLEELAATAPE